MATSTITKDMQNVYSSNETVIGTWTDGKPLYRKSFSGLAFGSTFNAWTNTGITLTGVKQLVSVKMTTVSSVSPQIIPLMGFRISNNNLQYYATTGWQNTYDVVVEYTKATD